MSFPKRGRLEIITGPMFSGKTTQFLTCMSTRSLFRRSCIITSKKDTRNDGGISTHNTILKTSHGSTPFSVTFLRDVPYLDFDVIGVDEAQFFEDLYSSVLLWIDSGKEVIVSGLDGNFHRDPIGQILLLVPLCRKITKLLSMCSVCAKNGILDVDAPYSKKISGDPSKITEIGGADMYIPVCEHCYKE